MGTRLGLHNLLIQVTGLNNIYFQPPEDHKLLYPCVMYSLDKTDTNYASNKPYRHKKRYSVIIIDSDPDSLTPGKLELLPTCSHDQNYVTNNLNHFAYSLYF